MKTLKNNIIIACFLFFGFSICGIAAEQPSEGVQLHMKGKIEAAKTLLQVKADNGDAEACFYLSQILLFDKKTSVQTGLKWLYQSIKLGFTPAMDALGGYYLHGEFLPENPQKAALYYKLAANQGYGPSQFNYGIMQKNGEKIPQDLEESFVYLAFAALNHIDLGEVTLDAAHYRDEVAQQLSPEAYQRALIKINQLSQKK